MSSSVQAGIDARAFRVEIPSRALDDLRRRVAATRWPSKELVGDRSRGVRVVCVDSPVRPQPES